MVVYLKFFLPLLEIKLFTALVDSPRFLTKQLEPETHPLKQLLVRQSSSQNIPAHKLREIPLPKIKTLLTYQPRNDYIQVMVVRGGPHDAIADIRRMLVVPLAEVRIDKEQLVLEEWVHGLPGLGFVV